MNKENLGAENKKYAKRDEFCVWQNAGKASLEKDVGEEYVLPDYLPNMRKILFSRVKTEGGKHFVDSGRIELEGEVTVYVVYLSDTNEIKYVSRSFSYDGVVNIDGVFDDSVVFVDKEIKNKTVRAISPRKLSLRATVLCEVFAKNKICISPKIMGSTSMEDEFTLERKTNISESADYVTVNENDIRLSEDIEYNGKRPIKELLFFDLDILTTDCKYSGGKMEIKGTAILKCVVDTGGSDEEKEYELIEKRIPVYHSFEVELPNAPWECRAMLELYDFECGAANDSYGESRIIEADIALNAVVTCITNETNVFTDDIFSVEYGYDNSYRTVEKEKLYRCLYTNFSVDGTGELPESEQGEYRKIVYSTSDAYIDQTEYKNNKLVFSGKCNAKGIAETAENGYVSFDITFPIRYEMQAEGIKEHKCLTKCGVVDSRVSISDGRLNVNSEIMLNSVIFDVDTVNTVDQVLLDKSSSAKKHDGKTMILYYPDESETLWSVAKKYGVSRSSLEGANNREMHEKLPRVLVIPT